MSSSQEVQSTADQSQQSVDVDVNPPVTASVFRVDLRPYYSFWDKPSLPELHEAIDTTFPMECPIIMEGRQNYRCSFTIYLNRLVPIDPIPTIKIRKPLLSAFTDSSITIPLSPLVDYGTGRGSQESTRVDGTLLTIVQAATRGRFIPNEEFDKYFAQLGEVTKECELQKDRELHKFNGNRYLIVKMKDGVKIPDTITIQDPTTKRSYQYYVRYAGKQWQCGRCDVNHSGSCPKTKALKECDQYRRANPKTANIIGDSTIRHLEERAFTADVAAMPGGTLGQLVAAAVTHPALKEKEMTYVVGGTNDVILSSAELELDIETRCRQYTHTVDSLVNAVVGTVTKPDTTPLQIVLTPPLNLRPEEQARLQYLTEPLRKIAQDQPKFTLAEVQESVERTADGHPTLNGTGKLIESVIHGKFLINKDVALYARPYNGLQRMWKGGCKTCGCVGLYYDSYDKCSDCSNRVGTHESQHNWKELFEKYLGPPPQPAEEPEPSNKKPRHEPQPNPPTPAATTPSVIDQSVVTPLPTNNADQVTTEMETV